MFVVDLAVTVVFENKVQIEPRHAEFGAIRGGHFHVRGFRRSAAATARGNQGKGGSVECRSSNFF